MFVFLQKILAFLKLQNQLIHQEKQVITCVQIRLGYVRLMGGGGSEGP